MYQERLEQAQAEVERLEHGVVKGYFTEAKLKIESKLDRNQA